MQEPKVDQIVKQVAQKLQDRSQVGIRKYGTTIWENTDENYVKHLQDELLDGANYCEQLMRLGELTTLIIKIVEAEPNDMMLGARIRAICKGIKEEK